jgi:hypothetical protein
MTRPTMLLLQSLTSSGIRMFALLLTMTTAALAGVTVYFPVSGSTVTSPVHIRAAATSTYPITYTRIYVDNVSVWGSAVSRFNTYLNMKAGNHYVVVQAWDSTGAVFKTPLNLVVHLLDGRHRVLSMPFLAGTTHVMGRYGFTQNNFLLEGANRIRNFAAPAIFVYMYPSFRQAYPDKQANLWPSVTPTSLTQLAQTAPYQRLFNMPFRTFVITAYTFANSDNVAGFATDPSMAVTEEREFYDLTRYLYATYAGTGKTFILKHWEGDWVGLQGYDTSKNISSTMVNAMITWLTARQNGVANARRDVGDPLGIGVFHAVEVNRVMDYVLYGMVRVINAVVPVVKPDMVTYSSYDSSLAGTSPTTTAAVMNQALSAIKSLTPDPLGLGSHRILISEFSLSEKVFPTETIWRSQTILQTSKSAGLLGAFLWQLYDNNCKTSSGAYYPVDSSWGSLRPTNSQCRGQWLVLPDGSGSSVLTVLSPYWSAQ